MTDEIVVPVPADYDETQAEAFRAGFRTCAQLFGQAAETYYRASASEGGEPPDSDAEDGDAECEDCGGEPVASMGAAETVTPAGTVCPECELT